MNEKEDKMTMNNICEKWCELILKELNITEVDKNNVFCSIIYDPNKKTSCYTNEHIKYRFDENELTHFHYKANNDKKEYYVYIGICSHLNIIEVGKSSLPLSNTWHGDWVKKVELKNSNAPLMNHVISEIIDELDENVEKKDLKDKIKAENIIYEMNKDYKYIVFIPVSDEIIAKNLETKLQEHFNKNYSECYLDASKN